MDSDMEQHMSEPEAVSETLPHDSMVTVRLSEPPTLTIDTQSVQRDETSETDSNDPTTPVLTSAEANDDESLQISTPDAIAAKDLQDEASVYRDSSSPATRRGSHSSEGSAAEVNWEQLEKTEEQEPRDEASDDSTALLLARLEQENNLIYTDPKSGIIKSSKNLSRNSSSRPPSIQQLKRLVDGPTPASLRYSLIPAPPMTDLEFYAALVQDYTRTAQRLPTLLAKKIRCGIPPPLRGVVWQSMAGARDKLLEDQFDRLCGESSPYEGIIGKDLGRSFPGVEMFRDPEGDGQLMLGRVLKCFSLYDHKIGYCQGLGFIVGPLLMHMGDKQAFCVLVRLMEHYDLRSCFLPDLSGLHVRIHQFRQLLKQHQPKLSDHLDELQIEPAYVSQWFLSFFAVTCPLPMLFRIYDVLFAEGASETIMRVALSLMRKNEARILACTELEDVMQLLLSRGLWDCYHYNADEFVNDFVSLTGVVTCESLQSLEQSYKASLAVDAAATFDMVASAAGRFLGRLWAGANTSTKSTTQSPGLSAPTRPVSLLRRSPSKQSLASTLNSIEGTGSDSVVSSTSEATSNSRNSSNTDESSIRTQSVAYSLAPSKTNKDKNLHGQIEDLLTALSEMQRDHAILATQLQREREEREEDRMAVRSLLDGLKGTSAPKVMETPGSETSTEAVTLTDDLELDENTSEADDSPREETAPKEQAVLEPREKVDMSDLARFLEAIEERFTVNDHRRSSIIQSKAQMREELVRSKEQLITEVSKSQEFSRQISEQQQIILTLRDQVRDGHAHIRNGQSERLRLEKQIHELKARKSLTLTPDANKENDSDWSSRRLSNSGLRELKLGRTNSPVSQGHTFTPRSSSLNISITPVNEDGESSPLAQLIEKKPEPDVDALVLELVEAKTAQAVARQEADEAKAKLESLRKLLGVSTSESSISKHKPSPSQPLLERTPTFDGLSTLTSFMGKTTPKVETPTPVSGVSSGFWGGWGKRAVSTEKSPSST